MVRKLIYTDLTDELLDELRNLEDAGAVVKHCAEKGLEIDEEDAGQILGDLKDE